MARDRRGFTLVELIVVTVLGAFVVMASLQVLITNQRTYTAQNARIQGQQATRAAIDVLSVEFREVSAQGGDILAMSGDSIFIRTMRKFGVVCEVDWYGSPPKGKVLKLGEYFEVDDSVFIFADNQTNLSDDDTWISAKVTGVDTTAACGAEEATEVSFNGQGSLFLADTVRTGAPLRSYTRYVYGLFKVDGDYYLGRRTPGQSAVPLVGPVRESDGVEFSYLDGNGHTTTTTTAVRQIVVNIRTASGVLNSLGKMVSDSITGRIYTRN